ncbi:MAG: hypothetical protein MUE52_20075 [Tabrizicola sp.]|nr:hypothetical protein [Tabrizicola sp.]
MKRPFFNSSPGWRRPENQWLIDQSAPMGRDGGEGQGFQGAVFGAAGQKLDLDIQIARPDRRAEFHQVLGAGHGGQRVGKGDGQGLGVLVGGGDGGGCGEVFGKAG